MFGKNRNVGQKYKWSKIEMWSKLYLLNCNTIKKFWKKS